jgi:hypothetical protein
MSIRTTSEHASAIPTGRSTSGARLALPLGLAALALLCGAALSQPAAAATKLCGDRDQLLKRLEQANEETPQAIGLSGDGGVVEVLVSPDGGWTMLVTYPKRPTCVVAAGAAWEMRQFSGEPA